MIPIDRIMVYNAITTNEGEETTDIVECIIREIKLYTSKMNELTGEPMLDKVVKEERILLLVPFNRIGLTINITNLISAEDISNKIEEVINKIGYEGLESYFNNNPTAVKMFKEDFLKKYIDEFINKKEDVTNETN